MNEQKEKQLMNKIIIALVGKAGSGKDTIASALKAQRPEWNMIVSCTTRPMREGEQEGVNYYYLTNEEFAAKVLNGDMLEVTYFNNWHYGAAKSCLKDGVNIGVFNPEGFDCLRETQLYDNEITVIGFYIDCEDKLRMLRQLSRESNPDVEEICRRFFADLEDFEDVVADIEAYGLKYTKNNTLVDLEDTVAYIQQVVDNLVSPD